MDNRFFRWDRCFPSKDLPGVAALGLLALMVTVPFLVPIHHPPITSFYEEWDAVFLGTTAAFAITLFRPLRVVIPGLTLLPGLLLLLAMGQWILGIPIYREAVLLHAGYLSWGALMLVLGATLRQRMGTASLFGTLATAALAGSLLSAVLGIMQYARFPLPGDILFPAIPGHVIANIAQPNLLASYLWIGIAAAVYLVAQGRLPLRAALPAIVALGFTIGLTLSRMAILEGVLLLAMRLFVRKSSRSDAFRLRSVLVLSGLIALVAGGVTLKMWPVADEPVVMVSVLDRLSTKSITSDGRLAIWRGTFSMIADHPWRGNGIGNYPWRMVETAAMAPRGETTTPGVEHAHNALLQVAADFGLPALLVCLLLLLMWARQIRFDENGAEQWAADLLAIIGLHSLLEYPLWDSEFLGLASLAAGAIAARPKIIVFPDSSTLLRLGLAGAIFALIPLRLDYEALDEATNYPRSHQPSDAEFRQRIQVVAQLATHSGLGAYANIVLGVLVQPEKRLAHKQSLVCERAMGIWTDPVIITRCAVLRLLDGRNREADELITTVARAFRDEPHRQAVSYVLSEAEKKNPEAHRLGVLWKNETED